MSNLTITNNDIGNVILKDAQFRDETLKAAGADTILSGTILARKEVEDAITVTPDVGNTGDGTVTLASVVAGPEVPIAGSWNLECIEAVTNGGIFKLEDPNGALINARLIMTAGAGAETTFELAGMTFKITDGVADFIVGDKFALVVAADGTLVVFAIAGAGGAQKPKAILTYDVVAAGAGDIPIRAGVKGLYRKERLIIDADGDGSNITDAILDQLRDFGLVPIDVQELNIQDNQ